jgi:hypothetical protein
LFPFAGLSRVNVDALLDPYMQLYASNVHEGLPPHQGWTSAILQTHAATDGQGLPLKRLDADIAIEAQLKLLQSSALQMQFSPLKALKIPMI